MAQEAKYVGQFDDMNLSDAWESYAMLVGYLTNTYKIPLSQIKLLFDNINELIPSAATPLNQLADKAYVDFGVEQMAAKYLSADAQGNPFSSYQAFEQGPYYYAGSIATPTKNDYALVNGDETHDDAITRYWYNGTSWDFQYVVNNTPLNQEQLAAINSTINATKVSNYESHISNTTIHVTAQNKQDWNAKYDKPNDGIPKTDLASNVQSSLEKADNSVQQEAGKGLSTNDFTNEFKSKLDSIENGAEVNVQSDWNESNSSNDAFIKNKPTKLSDFTDDLAKDNVPVSESNKYVKSGGVYANEQVLVESINEIRRDVDALKDVKRFDTLECNTIQTMSIPKVGDSEMILKGEGAPSLEPEFVGQAYLDTTNNILYYAFGTETTSWKSSQPTEIITDSVVNEIWNGVFV